MKKLIALSSQEAVAVDVSGLLPIGGQNSSGRVIKGLKAPDDYAVVSADEASIIVHPLMGKKVGPIPMAGGNLLEIDDLTLVVIEEQNEIRPENPFDSEEFKAEFLSLLGQFSSAEDLTASLKCLLRILISKARMEKGLLIIRSVKGKFELAAQEGLNNNDPWMSESLIQETMTSQKSISIQNVFGSRFESNKSLMATGFMSVYTWPLLVRGELLGVALIGSNRPHSGMSSSENTAAQTLIQTAALMLWFHLRDIKLKQEMDALKMSQKTNEDVPLNTTDESLLNTISMARKVAPTSLSVLIQGETGVGKELLASWIHRTSDRAKGSFVALNCGAIPADILESLLFGHKKGAFTGAHQDQIGKFQMADRGTLFLDEIADLPESLQVKLLRALQEKSIEPLGGTKPVKLDVRVIAASHKSLPDLISMGKFREDLYFRLAEITLVIPPLRQRPSDVALLSMTFLKEFGAERRFSERAWNWLQSQGWKGNVRELRSAIKRASILASGAEIEISDFTMGIPSAITDESSWLGGETLEKAKAAFVMEKVRQALQRSGGQRNKAAELLGITPRTLFRYLEEKDSGELTELSL